MKDGRKKLKICLALMLIAAIAAGAVYYFRYMPRSGEKINEGTLIRRDAGETDADTRPDPENAKQAEGAKQAVKCGTGAAAMRNANGK